MSRNYYTSSYDSTFETKLPSYVGRIHGVLLYMKRHFQPSIYDISLKTNTIIIPIMPPPLQLRSALSTLPLASSSPYLPTTASPSRPRFIISNSTASSSSTRRRAASTTTTTTSTPRSSPSSSSTSSPDQPSVQSITRSQRQQQQQLLDIKSAADPRIISLPANPTATPSSTTTISSTTTLPWNQYLQLRKTRRYYNLAASACTSFATTAAGISILSQQDLEALGGTVPGLDPFLLLGLATAGSGAVGWLLGPFVGNAVFGLSHRKLGAQITAVRIKSKPFLHSSLFLFLFLLPLLDFSFSSFFFGG